MRTGPGPRWEGLLRRVLPTGTIGESIIGDLREEFSRDLAESGPLRAHLRHLKRTISVATRFAGGPSPQPSRTPGARRPRTPHSRHPGAAMSAFLFDLRTSIRILVRKPGLTLAAILSLGLGIGAGTAIFSVVQAVILRPLPYPDSGELVELFRVDERVTGLNPTPTTVSGLYAVPFEVHRDWLAMSNSFSSGGCYAGRTARMETGDGLETLSGALMTAGAFEALRTPAARGRVFLPSDDEVGADPVAILSHGLWESRFGGDPDVLGSQITVNGISHTVVGIMPPGFSFPGTNRQIWISFTDDQKTSPTRNGGYLKVVARLAPGITLEEARQELEGVARRIGELHPEEAEHRVGIFSLKEMVIGGDGTGLVVLMGAVILVLLIACTNIAGLFLVRATERRREIGVRRALGAGGTRLAFQHLYESLILSFLGAGVGGGLALVGLEPLLSLMPSQLPRLGELEVDGGLLLVALGFAVVTGLLTGIAPALTAARTPITSVLKEGGRGQSGTRSRNRVQRVLVVSQVALAFVLLTGAGLFIRTMEGLLAVDTGLRTQGVALLQVTGVDRAETQEEVWLFFEELEERLRALPGVVDVGAAEQMPFAGGWSSPPVSVETPDGVSEMVLNFPTVTPSYFSTMEIPIVAGRGLGPDDTPESEPVVVVSEALAQRMAPEGSPLGMRIRLNSGEDAVWWTVVGVVGNVKYRLNFSDMPMAYASMKQAPSFVDCWVIRTASDPGSLAGPIQRVREELDPGGTATFRVLDEVIRDSYAVASARFSVLLLGSLAALAALLAVLGVYGVLAYLVQLRSREIGIQIALGAGGTRVLGRILGNGLTMGALGLAVGGLLTFGLGRLVESQLFGVEPWDPMAMAGAGLLLLAASAASSYFPARRAARMNPVEVLKGE